MKILITVAVWGKKYRDLFTDYSLASQMAENNIPELSKDHTISYHIITSIIDKKNLEKHAQVKELGKYANIIWDALENHGYDPHAIPTGPAGEKYAFLSLLQNIAITKSFDHDAIMFNYADFIWSKGSMSHVIRNMAGGTDAVLSFCLPVDTTKGVKELDKFRRRRIRGAGVIELPERAGADLAIRCLHRETKLRYWDDPAFTVTPTYLMWPVDDEGIIVRAYHQTILALKVDANDPVYRAGIPGSSLDGYFTALLADRDGIHHLTSSDDALVFSLYETIVESHIGGPSRKEWAGFTRDVSLRECLRGVVSEGQRKFALKPIEVRRNYDQRNRWRKTINDSKKIIQSFHKTTEFDPDEFERMHNNEAGLEEISRLWKQNTHASLNGDRGLRNSLVGFYRNYVLHRMDLLYRKLLIALAGGAGGQVKKYIGANRARRLRLAVERLFFGAPRSQPVSDIEQPNVDPIASVTRELLLSGKWREIVDLLLPMLQPIDLVPGVAVSRSALAMMRIGSLSEEMITETNDMADLEATLLCAEEALRALTAEAPSWIEGHRALARNLWFQGRIDEAMKCFEGAERRLPSLAKAAGWEPNDRVILPRNCAQVIGLMGHIDAFVKQKILNNDRRPYHLISPQLEVVNQTFLEYWKSYLHVELLPPDVPPAPTQIEAAYTVNWNWVLPRGKNTLTHVHRGIARIQRQWEKDQRESLLRLNLVHSEMLDRQKAAWGMADKDWFVCLHVRSAGFYDEQDHAAQHFRNTHIDDYYPMIKWILDNGGWVVRMGDASAPPLDQDAFGKNADRVIDYAHSPEKSPALDVALCASCRLFVSSPSGLHTVAHAFGRPACYVNYPVYAGFPWHPGEIFIPQRYFSHRLKRVLTLSEILSSTLVHADHHFMLKRAGIELIHNSATDILETVREALNPDEYTISNARAGTLVRQEFDRLNSEHEVDISGQLGLHFCAEYADELCPEIDGENVSSYSAPHVSVGKVALSAAGAPTPNDAWNRSISS